MKSRIITALDRLSIRTYCILEERKTGVELFFIKQRLDMKRRTNVHSFDVIIYNDFEKEGTPMRGFSSVHIYDGMTDAEMEKTLSDAYLAASFVKNKAYKIPKGTAAPCIDMETDLSAKSLEENCKIMTAALFANDNTDGAFINSAEIFLSQTECFITNSEGTDVSYRKWNVSGEFVTQCKEPQDVELYHSFRYTSLNAGALKAKVKAALEMTVARSQAVTAPTVGKYRVILSGDTLRQFFNYYMSRSSSAYIYAGYSNYKLDTFVQGENVKGDVLTITAMAEEPYSDEGTRMIDRPLLDKGVLKTIHGGLRFADYLGIEPTGFYRRIKVDLGTTSFEEMKKQPYLHVVSFSAFETDDLSGHFGGEIRLAFLFDGEKVTPVTGGSINGNILEVQENLTLSSDTLYENNYEGPYAVSMEGINVSGNAE